MMYVIGMDSDGMIYINKYYDDRFRHLSNITVIIAKM
jgi:hypothetical protein